MAQAQRALHTLHFVQGKCHELMLGIDCSVLQCVAVRCSVLRHGPGVPCIGDASFGARKVSHTHATSRLCCSVLQCVAVCCSVLHCGPGASCMGDGSFGGRKVLP